MAKEVVIMALGCLIMASKIQYGWGQIGTKEPLQCWAGLSSASGCIVAVNEAILMGNPSRLNPPCCLLINALGNDCWPAMFPEFPGVDLLLRDICALFTIFPPLPPLLPGPPVNFTS